MTQFLLITIVNGMLIKYRVWCERRGFQARDYCWMKVIPITDSSPYYNYVVEIFVAQNLCVGSVWTVRWKHTNA